MPFKHSCFISYCHGQGEVIRPFVERLKDGLDSYLEPYLDERVYVDVERLLPGYHYNVALARALCESVCMIVVYVPRYERHAYCRREYAAMEAIERARFAALGVGSRETMGLIVPVVLRGRREELPPRLGEHRHYADFSRYTTASPDILRDHDCAKKLSQIAEYVYEVHQRFATLDKDVCADCPGFSLPSLDTLEPWRASLTSGAMPFPFR